MMPQAPVQGSWSSVVRQFGPQLVFILLLCCGYTTSHAQAQAPPSAPASPSSPASPSVASKLQEYESKYQDNLRKIHAPLLQQYLADLTALLPRMVVAPDKEAVKAEIARVEKTIAEGGTLNLSPPQPQALAAANNKPGIIFTLEPSEASTPPVTNLAGDAVTPIGQAAWTLSKLPAGSYSLVVHYSCPQVPAAAVLSFTFAGVTKEREIKPSAATVKDKNYRLFTLPLVVTHDTTMEQVKLTSKDGGAPWFFVRQIVIVKPKEPLP